MSVGFGGFAKSICLVCGLIPGTCQGAWWAFILYWGREGVPPRHIPWKLVCLVRTVVEPADTCCHWLPGQGLHNLQRLCREQWTPRVLEAFIGAPCPWDGRYSGPAPSRSVGFEALDLRMVYGYAHPQALGPPINTWYSELNGSHWRWLPLELTWVSVFSTSAWRQWGEPLYLRGALCLWGGLDYHCGSQGTCPSLPTWQQLPVKWVPSAPAPWADGPSLSRVGSSTVKWSLWIFVRKVSLYCMSDLFKTVRQPVMVAELMEARTWQWQ